MSVVKILPTENSRLMIGLVRMCEAHDASRAHWPSSYLSSLLRCDQLALFGFVATDGKPHAFMMMKTFYPPEGPVDNAGVDQKYYIFKRMLSVAPVSDNLRCLLIDKIMIASTRDVLMVLSDNRSFLSYKRLCNSTNAICCEIIEKRYYHTWRLDTICKNVLTEGKKVVILFKVIIKTVVVLYVVHCSLLL